MVRQSILGFLSQSSFKSGEKRSDPTYTDALLSCFLHRYVRQQIIVGPVPGDMALKHLPAKLWGPEIPKRVRQVTVVVAPSAGHKSARSDQTFPDMQEDCVINPADGSAVSGLRASPNQFFSQVQEINRPEWIR